MRIPNRARSLLKALLVAFVALAILGAAASADTFGPPPPGERGERPEMRGPGGPMIGIFFAPELELTSDQLTNIQTIFESSKGILDADMAAVRKAENALLSYLVSGGSDSTEIATYIGALSSASETLKTEEANFFIIAYSLLTDTQKTTLTALLANMQSNNSSSSSSSVVTKMFSQNQGKY